MPIRSVTIAGPTLNSARANPIETTKETAIVVREISACTSPSSFSSREATLAEMARARKPIASDSPSATTPRTTGRRQTRRRCIGEVMSRTTRSIAPSGRRTATAQLEGLRIMTPSRTACPPIVTGASLSAGLAATRAAGLLEAALEALHPPTGVDELLLPRVERVARRADLDVQLRLRRARRELVAAGATNGREHVLWVDTGLHRRARIAEAVSGETLPPETTTPTPRGATSPVRSGASAVAAAGSAASLARS